MQSDVDRQAAEAPGLACDLLTPVDVKEAVGFDGQVFEEGDGDPGYCRWDDGKRVGALASVNINDAYGLPEDVAPSTDGRVVNVAGATVVLQLDFTEGGEPFEVLSALITSPIEDWIGRPEPIQDEDLVRSLALSLQRMMHQWDAVSCAGVGGGETLLSDVFDGTDESFDAVREATEARGCGDTTVIGVEGPNHLETQMANGFVIARAATQRADQEPIFWLAYFVETATGWKLGASDGGGPLVPYCAPPSGFDLPTPPGC